MTVFMEIIRKQQSDLAGEIWDRLRPSIGKGALDQLSELLETASPDDIPEISEELFLEILEQEVQQDILAATHGYIDWLSASLVRSGNLERQTLPRWTPEVQERIAAMYGVPVNLLKRVAAMLVEKKELPLAGRIQGDMIVPNRDSLLQWRDLFDWD